MIPYVVPIHNGPVVMADADKIFATVLCIFVVGCIVSVLGCLLDDRHDDIWTVAGLFFMFGSLFEIILWVLMVIWR